MPADSSRDYLLDTPYTWGFYPEFAPLHLDYVAMMCGAGPARQRDGFRFLELGCGNGVSLNTFAACFPEGRFDGVDFNPEHVANATSTAAAAGLDNVRFHECDFAGFHARAEGPYDFVALHGVYSWVAPEIRRQIRQVVSKWLRPGGIAFVSYNAMPGWAPLLPLRRMMLSYTASLDASSDERARRGLQYLRHLRDNGARFFRDNPAAGRLIDQMSKSDPRYLAHEYFHRHWYAFYFDEVADELAECDLRFLGSTSTARNIDDFSVPAAFRALLKTAPDRVVYENHRGFVLNELFRRDVYVKQPAAPLEPDVRKSWGDVIFGPLGMREQLRRELDFPAGRIRLDGDISTRLIDLLAERSVAFGEIVVAMDLAKVEPRAVLNGLHALCASGQFGVFRRHLHSASGTPGRVRLASAFNRAMLEHRLILDGRVCLASDVSGTGVSVDWLPGLVLLAEDRADSARPEAWAWAFIKRNELTMRIDGQPIASDARGLELLREQFATIRRRYFPYLESRGVLIAAPGPAGGEGGG